METIYLRNGEMKILKTVFGRLTFTILMVLIEIAVIWGVFRWFGEEAAWIEWVLRVLGAIVVLAIIKNSRHLSLNLMFIMGIVIFPVAGTALYLLMGADLLTSRTVRALRKSTAETEHYYVQDPEVTAEMGGAAPQYRGQFHYISEEAGFPFYRNTGFDYYRLGDDAFPVMLEELRKAQKFIFLEYFIIQEGIMWDSILGILEEKARAGVDVRVMYDDIGSFLKLSGGYARELEARGIRCIPFNRINPVIGIIKNHRDHRKILVIDGRVAFSGGINLADEYINARTVYGHWKDNAFRVTGEAVWSYTVMFLTHWNALSREKDEDYSVYRGEGESAKEDAAETAEDAESAATAGMSRDVAEESKWAAATADGQSVFDGYIAPYGETPLDGEIIAQDIYMNILNQAVNYCYIFTPYLVIDTEMINALILAAKRGVDVRIVMPGIYDKLIVREVSRSYYSELLDGGVKIYEYTPGFVHAKVFVADDIVAVTGTINLDYRSLYLHFENGTYLFGAAGVLDIRDDVTDTIAKSRAVSVEDTHTGPLKALLIALLRLIAPLM